MHLHSDRLAALLVGENRTRTRRALGLAAVLLAVTVTIEYLLFRTGFENRAVETLHEVFLLAGYVPSWEGTGAAFVFGLAALHAYLNEGYLPSLLLGWSPAFGNLIWTNGSRSDVGNYYLDPLAAFERTFPEALALATLGFVVGIGVRRLRKHRRSDTAPRSENESESKPKSESKHKSKSDGVRSAR